MTIDYLKKMKNETPIVTSTWVNNILEWDIVFSDFLVKCNVDLTSYDLSISNNPNINNEPFNFDFSDLGDFSKNEKKEFKEVLNQYIPFWTDLAKKEIELCINC